MDDRTASVIGEALTLEVNVLHKRFERRSTGCRSNNVVKVYG